ncbi:hypothetical protein Tco_1471104, partial [Tanacetum coccineum]
MADSSTHKPSSHEITPKEEPVTLDKPESPNPFLLADQVEFIFENIAFTINNETLDDSKIWVSTPTRGIREDIGINTFRNALRAHYLPHSSMYVSPPSITIVRPWFATIGGKTGDLDQISNKDATIRYCLANGVKVDYARLIWEDIIHKLSKKTREKVVPYP